jgi:hypothetical protein
MGSYSREVRTERNYTMFSAITIKTAAAAAGIAAATVLTTTTATTAWAGPAKPFGSMQEITGASGAEVTDYMVSDLQPSGNNDGVWSANVTVKSVKGTTTPVIGDFNARADDGTSYTTIEGTNPGGLTNQPIAPGNAATGKIYFQVNNGAAPNSVVYSTGGNADQLVWKS